MLFSARAAGKYVGVQHQTLARWSRAGLIPFGVRPLQDGQPTYHRWDLDYARDVVAPRPGARAGTVHTAYTLKRQAAGIVQGGRPWSGRT